MEPTYTIQNLLFLLWIYFGTVQSYHLQKKKKIEKKRRGKIKLDN